MRSLIKYFFIPFLALLMTACMKDKGNYSYKNINKVTITGIDTEYYVNLNRPVLIHPLLSFTQDQVADTGRYKYQWIFDGTSDYHIPTDTISTSHDLNMIMNPKYGCQDYTGYYRVTDTVTGIYSQKNFIMHVVTPSYEGWLLLCDMEDGTSRLDMISQRGDQDSLYVDVLKAVGSTFPMNAPPAFVAAGPVSIAPAYGLIAPLMGTTSSATVLGLDTLEYKNAYNFNSLIVGQKITDYTGADMIVRFDGATLYAQNNIYDLYYDGTISVPVNHLDNSPAFFKAAHFMASDPFGDIYMLYNTETNSIVNYYSGDVTCNTITAGNLFDYAINNNAPGGMDLIYMEGTTYNNGEVFSVLKAKTTGKCYLARCSPDGSSQTYYDEIKGADIGLAAHFAVSPDYGYLFYNVGSKVYEYDMSLRQSFLMEDYGSKTITVLKFNFFNFSDIAGWQQLPQNYTKYSALRKKLLVATYDQGNARTSGKLDIYNIPPINQALTLYKSYTGTGKITSIAFRER